MVGFSIYLSCDLSVPGVCLYLQAGLSLSIIKGQAAVH